MDTGWIQDRYRNPCGILQAASLYSSTVHRLPSPVSWLHRIHKRLLDAVEDDAAEDDDHHHKAEAVQ